MDLEISGQIVATYQGSTLKFCGGSGPPALLIPSLINSASILDIPDHSFINSLKTSGFSVYIAEWCSHNIHSINDAINTIQSFINAIAAPVFMIGHCMGGIMAILSGALKPQAVLGIATIATPWNFSKTDFPNLKFSAIPYTTKIPKELFEIYFYSKYFFDMNIRYKNSNPEDMHAIETWLRSGTDLNSSFFLQWQEEIINKNCLLCPEFTLGEVLYKISKCTFPVISIYGEYDTISPTSSCVDINISLEHAKLIGINTGHIGLVTKHRWRLADEVASFFHLPRPSFSGT